VFLDLFSGYFASQKVSVVLAQETRSSPEKIWELARVARATMVHTLKKGLHLCETTLFNWKPFKVGHRKSVEDFLKTEKYIHSIGTCYCVSNLGDLGGFTLKRSERSFGINKQPPLFSQEDLTTIPWLDEIYLSTSSSVPIPYFVMLVGTFKGKLRLDFCYSKSSLNAAEVTRIADDTVSLLQSASQNK